MITQKELLRQFIEEGITSGDAGNGHVKGNQFIHFETPILERYGKKYLSNQSRYSEVTGLLQKKMIALIGEENLVRVSKVEVGYKGSLKDYIKK